MGGRMSQIEQRAIPLLTVLIVFLLLVSCAPDPIPEGLAGDEARRARVEAMYEAFRSDFPDVKEIDVQEFVELQERGVVVIIDLREDAERAVSMSPEPFAKRPSNR
jgi:hypothetical protein